MAREALGRKEMQRLPRNSPRGGASLLSPTRTRTECEAHGLKFDQVCLDLEVVAERPKLSHQLHTTWGGGHSAAYITSLPRTQTDRTQTTAGKCWRCVRLRESRDPPGVIQRRACRKFKRHLANR